MRSGLLLLVVATAACGPRDEAAAPGGRPNVLFIVIDDLNDWVGYLDGHPNTRTPNLDRLASRGVYFTNAYTVSPICGPSRASVLTGMRPETTGVYNNLGTYKDYVPDATALPRFLRENGYRVMGAGKINHAMGMVVPENYDEYGPDAGAIGGPFTWEELSMNPGKEVDRSDILGRGSGGESGIVVDRYPGKVIRRGTLEATLPLNGIDNRLDRPLNGYNTFDWGPVDVADDEMPDGRMARWAAEKLAQEYDQPFFLGVGFYRPHQPFYAPRTYFQAFAGESIAPPEVVEGDLSDLATAARHYAHYPWSGSFARVQEHDAWPEGVLGYLASIHFVDAQVGRVLDALDRSAHRDNTLIVLWSDHGWELGEKEHWGKHSPWEGSIRVPFVIVPPRTRSAKAGPHASLVSLLDIYPTIADYCGLPAPEELEGLSLRPLVDGSRSRVRDHHVTTLGRASYALRAGDLKLIHYYDGTEELYDLAADPHEWTNLAGRDEYEEVTAGLREKLPVDPRFTRLARCSNWKAVVTADGPLHLYDMLDPRDGIGEQNEVSGENPDVVQVIRKRLREEKGHHRYVTLTDCPLPGNQGDAGSVGWVSK